MRVLPKLLGEFSQLLDELAQLLGEFSQLLDELAQLLGELSQLLGEAPRTVLSALATIGATSSSAISNLVLFICFSCIITGSIIGSTGIAGSFIGSIGNTGRHHRYHGLITPFFSYSPQEIQELATISPSYTTLPPADSIHLFAYISGASLIPFCLSALLLPWSATAYCLACLHRLVLTALHDLSHSLDTHRLIYQ